MKLRHLIKILLNHKGWHIENKGTSYEEVVYFTSWRYYVSTDCICLRDINRNIVREQHVFSYAIILPFAILNTYKTKKRERKNKY